jgi:hypothetical protein
MKTKLFVVGLGLLACRMACGQVAGFGGAADREAYSISERGPHNKVWERMELVPTMDGRTAEQRHSYQELATGMHYREGDQWRESEAKIEILPNNAGAVAAKGQHKVIFPVELKTGIVELQTPDGQWLRSRIWGLAYFDDSTGESVLLAEVKASDGQLMGDNVIVYPDTFSDVRADVRYTYTRASFEQDVVFREQPPAPDKFGLNPRTTRLQALTEFVEAPQPIQRAEPAGELSDVSLGFGTMSIGAGRAFSVDADGDATGEAPVAKEWGQLEGRNFLIEEILYDQIAVELQKLPEPKRGASLERRGQGNNVLAGLKTLMPKRYAKAGPRPEGKLKRMAKISPRSAPGFVMDYVTLNTSQANYTFQGDTTYYISGTVNLSGTTTIESGTVIKFANSTSAKLSSPAPVCLTDAYRMAVLTSLNDNSVGETISGSSGSPATMVSTFLDLTGGGSAVLKYLRFAYASNAIAHSSFSGDVNPVWNCQFLRCSTVIKVTPSSGAGSVRLYNDLISQCTNVVHDTSSSYAQHLSAEQVTIDQVINLITNAAANGSSLYVTNSLLTSSGGISPATGSTNLMNTARLASSAGVYQGVGGGNYYLINASTNRNAGTTNINVTLLTSLPKKTTSPPIAWTNTTFTTVQTFSPQAQRDADTPDLGYHYDPLDFTFGGCVANSNVTFTAGTAVGWFRTSSGWYHAGHGLKLNDKQIAAFNGTVTSPCYWVRLTTTQESDRTAGYGVGGITCWAGSIANAGEVQAKFTRCSMLNNDAWNHFRDDSGWLNVRATHCEFYHNAVSGYAISMYFTNCLFVRNSLGQSSGNGPCTVVLQNCTMKGNLLYLQPSYVSTYLVKDSAFDSVTFSIGGYAANASYATYDYNAYTNTSNPFPLGGAHDVSVGSTFNWQTSWLGNFYLPSDSTLLDVGSITAPNAGLYHFTTQTNETSVESTSQVDIGYHYVGVNSSGLPLDYDSDGIPDYLEDANGNGSVDSGETDWQVAGDLGLKVLITEPKRTTNLP